jgi:hypothetical protein
MAQSWLEAGSGGVDRNWVVYGCPEGSPARRDAPQLGPVRRDRQPPPGRGGKRVADVFPPPVVPFAEHADNPPPGEVIEHAENVLRDGVPEVVSPAVHDLIVH